ncbi:hypothetical protein THALO_110091 [Tenacibaculum halocynthiae]
MILQLQLINLSFFVCEVFYNVDSIIIIGRGVFGSLRERNADIYSVDKLKFING